MTWPDAWPTVVVNADFTAAGPSGGVATGRVEFQTIPARLPSAQYGVIAVGTISRPLSGGLVSAEIAAVDSLTDVTFVWQVTEILDGLPVRSYVISPTAASSPVNLATAVYTGELPPHYTVIDGPQGLKGDKGDRGQDGGGGNYDPAGSAATALATAEAYTDTKVTAEVGRADAAYDHTGAASTAAAAALASAHTYADTGDATTLAAAEAYTDAHAGGGFQGCLTVQKYINKEIITLATTGGSYQVVTTSDGTPISAQIDAAAGNRVLASVGFLRSPAGLNLDIALMLADGVTPSIYGATGDGTTGAEGNVQFYPQGLNFPQTANEIQFPVGAQHISGGKVTIALVYQGTADGTQRIYAGLGYLFRWLLKNPDKPQT